MTTTEVVRNSWSSLSSVFVSHYTTRLTAKLRRPGKAADCTKVNYTTASQLPQNTQRTGLAKNDDCLHRVHIIFRGDMPLA